jgi:amidase
MVSMKTSRSDSKSRPSASRFARGSGTDADAGQELQARAREAAPAAYRLGRADVVGSLVVAVLLAVASANASAASVALADASIEQLNQAFARGTLTSEQLVALSLKRIEAYDDAGPKLNALITVNPAALATARALDAERKAKGPRSALHGIPVILKDNYDTADLPTTAGSVFLAGSIPSTDAFMVAKLREAGAVILAKSNLSEFASSGKSNGFSSLGGQTLNPHDLTRGPAGSSGGSGAALAAWYSTIALGTDTGGSIRGPCAANGLACIKPTHGLLSRAGIVPLALSFDTGGPMARSVYDVAVALGAMTGIDAADPATSKSLGRSYHDYTVFLKRDALSGARLGILTDYAGTDDATKSIFATAVATLRSLGATVVEIKLPEHIRNRSSLTDIIRNAEFKAQIADYLGTLKGNYPHSLDDLLASAHGFKPTASAQANPARWELFEREKTGLPLTDPVYTSARDEGTAMVRSYVNAVLLQQNLDAFIYPTSPQPARPIVRDYAGDAAASGSSGTSLANITGFPDAIVPAGLTSEYLPVTLSFLGPAFSEPRLLGFAYAFEQATHARVAPRSTPALPGETIRY